MKKIFIVLVAVSLGVCSIAGCTQSDNNTNSTPSKQSQNSEQTSDTSSEQSQNSEQTSDTSSEQSQNSEQTSDTSSEQSQNSEQTSDTSSEQSQNSEQTSDTSSEQSQNSEQISDESKNPDESTSYSKITLSKAKDIIAEHDDFDDIWNEFNKTFGAADWYGGYNILTSEYWLDEDGKEQIWINHTYQEIYYLKYDDDRKLLDSEDLFRYTPD